MPKRQKMNLTELAGRYIVLVATDLTAVTAHPGPTGNRLVEWSRDTKREKFIRVCESGPYSCTLDTLRSIAHDRTKKD